MTPIEFVTEPEDTTMKWLLSILALSLFAVSAPSQDLRRDGKAVGRVEADGDVRVGGKVVGRIEKDGDVRKDGKVIGSAKGVPKERAAVLFFFGVFDPP